MKILRIIGRFILSTWFYKFTEEEKAEHQAFQP